MNLKNLKKSSAILPTNAAGETKTFISRDCHILIIFCFGLESVRESVVVHGKLEASKLNGG
ncbi:hypothetical protein BpHYR1_049599 [Brachionus plicatilis]|uniref:Uncharacterized protein n=1 Tax=Brachionus plicatilis TaxID=10195 RepID=A0A3M7QC90_BRAPC|nr:hypothetical protein BpHYR1_049599 [Brachionus plicatilis]